MHATSSIYRAFHSSCPPQTCAPRPFKMLPQHSAHVATAAEAPAATLATLPPASLARRILLAVPVMYRARASCVCRAWRDMLASPELWSQLELTWDVAWRTLLIHARATQGALSATNSTLVDAPVSLEPPARSDTRSSARTGARERCAPPRGGAMTSAQTRHAFLRPVQLSCCAGPPSAVPPRSAPEASARRQASPASPHRFSPWPRRRRPPLRLRARAARLGASVATGAVCACCCPCCLRLFCRRALVAATSPQT